MDSQCSENALTDSKTIILKQIERNPGIRYRELLRLTSLTNGGLQYHLKILERSHKVKVDRHDGRRTRYYPLDIRTSESQLLGCVRNNVDRHDGRRTRYYPLDIRTSESQLLGCV